MQTISEKSHENSIYCAATSHQTNFENFNRSEDPEQAFRRCGKSKLVRTRVELNFCMEPKQVYSQMLTESVRSIESKKHKLFT